jgi:hypothetical protein
LKCSGILKCTVGQMSLDIINGVWIVWHTSMGAKNKLPLESPNDHVCNFYNVGGLEIF